MTNNSNLFGFEDYKVVLLSSRILQYSQLDEWDVRAANITNSPIMLPSDDVLSHLYHDNSYYYYKLEDSICNDHKELLSTAKKVYVHPSCKISRTMLSTKYKKVLNPWTADVVVVPKVDEIRSYYYSCLAFINESAKAIFIVDTCYVGDNNKSILDSYSIDTTMGNMMIAKNTSHLINASVGYSFSSAVESELFYRGPLLCFDNSTQSAQDLLTNVLPKDKTVFEQTIQESLGGEENKITFDALTSLSDMLGSSDEDTVGAAFKTLSMMDYMHYPNSIKYILDINNFYLIRYNHATKSTSVKFMLSQLNSNKSRYISYDETIYQEDFNLLKKLIAWHKKLQNEGEVNKEIMTYPFISVNDNGYLVPNLKKSA